MKNPRTFSEGLAHKWRPIPRQSKAAGVTMSRRRIARGEGVAEFLRFDADGGEHGRLSRIWRLVAARVVGGCRVRDFARLDRFGGLCPGPQYYQCPTFNPPVLRS